MNAVAVTEKRCCTCKELVSLAEFSRNAKSKDGLGARCRPCVRIANAAWYQANKERSRELDRRWQANNPERAKELKALRWARWRAKEGNEERLKESRRVAMRKPERRIARSLWGVLRGQKQGARWTELLGYGEAELRTHLERQFVRGMSWANYGEWHIDHILPLTSFTFSGERDDPEIRRAWALTNLRPLWAIDNMRKNRRVESLL